MSLLLMCLVINADCKPLGRIFPVEVAPDLTVAKVAVEITQAAAAQGIIPNTRVQLILWKPKTGSLKTGNGRKLYEKVVALTFDESNGENAEVVVLDPAFGIDDYFTGVQLKGDVHLLAQLVPGVDTSEPSILAESNWTLQQKALSFTLAQEMDLHSNLEPIGLFNNQIFELQPANEPSFIADLDNELSKPRYVNLELIQLMNRFSSAIYVGGFFRAYTAVDEILESDRVSNAEYSHYASILSSNTLRSAAIFNRSKRRQFYALTCIQHDHFNMSMLEPLAYNKSWDLILRVIREDGVHQYTPKSDADIRYKGISHLIVEVHSNEKRTDEIRMLLQASCLARYCNTVRSEKYKETTIIISAIYVDEDAHARWYYVFAEDNNQVKFTSRKFNLSAPKEALKFILHLYNFEKRATADSEKLDHNNYPIGSINMDATKLTAITSVQLMKSNKKRKANPSEAPFITPAEAAALADAGFPLPSESLQTHDSLDIGSSPLALLTTRSLAGLDVFTKYTRRTERELKIFRHLSSAKPEENHVIHLLGQVPLRVGPALVLPRLQPLPSVIPYCSDVEIRTLCHQFLLSVAFLHDNSTAHLDTVVKRPSSSISLHIIDLDLAQIVKDKKVMIKGSQGTAGWRPKEMETDDVAFSPILADQWMAGKMLSYMLRYLGRRDMAYQTLVNISYSLMNPHLDRRPTLRSVIAEYEAQMS